MLLEHYLTKRGLSHIQFAKSIGVSGEAVRRYLKGERMPTPSVMSKIIDATHGKVTPNDLYRIKAEATQQ